MTRKIIKIDESKCDGCGLCVSACHEGAIGIVNGKAKLLCDNYCDGLGNCLPVCPTGAITFEEREAAAFDERAVKANLENERAGDTGREQTAYAETCLKQWPVQIKLVPPVAEFFHNAHLLVAADCAAYARGSFHSDYMKGKITIIGCPKLDNVDYSEKLAAIFMLNTIQSVTVARMEVPCCLGIENAVKAALKKSGKTIPLETAVIHISG